MEQANPSRVKVNSLLSVVSSKPTEPGRIHQLSGLDQAMGLHTIHIVLYYGSNPFIDGPMSSDLDNLRVSLSYLLDEYPVVTGRLTRGPAGGWRVKCNDAGVRTVQATVSATLDEWLRSADVPEERDLTVWEDMPQDPSFWSPFRIQINTFKCGALAIGLSCSHMQADITSATHLIKSWSQIHSLQPLTSPPIFTLPTHNNNNSIIPPPLSTTTPPKMSTITMKFSDPTVRKCLARVHTQCPDATPFDILIALLWPLIARNQSPPQSDCHKRSISICVDSRNRARSSSIPLNYFGNALDFSELTLDAHDLINGELGLLCEHIHRHVADSGNVGLGSGREGPFYGTRLTCVNMEHMVDGESGEGVMYSVVFSKGEKPVHVSCNYGNVGGEGMIMVMPSAEGGLARAVTVVLPEEQVERMCEDEEILDLKPVMVISGRR